MVQKLSISVLFTGLGAVSVLLLTNHIGIAIKVGNYLYFLMFLGVLSGIITYEKD